MRSGKESGPGLARVLAVSSSLRVPLTRFLVRPAPWPVGPWRAVTGRGGGLESRACERNADHEPAGFDRAVYELDALAMHHTQQLRIHHFLKNRDKPYLG